MFLFIHRLSQIFIFGTEIHGFFKGTALAPHRYYHGTSWLRLALQVHGLVCSVR